MPGVDRRPPDCSAYSDLDLQVNKNYTRLSEEDLDNNLPQALRMAGYHTGMAGKWHLDKVPLNQGETWPSYAAGVETVKRAGFDYVDGLYAHNFDTNTVGV